jgi:hypothetical protein
MFIFEKVGHSKFVEMHGDTSDFYLILNEIKVSLNQNGLLFKKVTFKILNE